MKLGLETETFHMYFQNGRMDAFGFIDQVVAYGLDGAQFNIVEYSEEEVSTEKCKEYQIDPVWGSLCSNDKAHLQAIREKLDEHGLYCELDMKGVETKRLEEVIEVAEILGADVIRTYINKGNYDPEKVKAGIEKIRIIEPLLKEKNIQLAIENHEEEVATEVVKLIKEIGSTHVGCLCDIGNGMMAWEDPKTTVDTLAPYAKSTHFKDHIVIRDGKYLRVSGCPVGYGNIDTDYCYKTLVMNSSLERINIEMCHPYVSTFKRPLGTGGVEYLGEGAFQIENPYIDPEIAAPLHTYKPSPENLEYLLEVQKRDADASVAYVKGLREKYKDLERGNK
ncbi:sugar phosphate isomerase/epimerase [Vagococcus sp. DIV0080]|uniref:Sugar phosphate isomerase/epimerase n=1 Tax=Candidatus Vagococcus giribetii TaxID=2230876 RepID=A0ABS3HXW4_9ENTE|nr:TIM barrel protein [Vagococcus sp. DIV0080]MBO0477651.1 sugar phosphate isomerase/epimerase [Vagococcus sp. DIV0080]